MSFLTPLFLLGPGRARGAGADSPDAAGAQVGRRVSVADVPAQDSVRVGAAAPHPRLAAAGAAPRGDRADRGGVRAAVPARLGSRRRARRRARHRRAARSLLQHGLRRFVVARAARRGAGARERDAGRSHLAWCCSPTPRRWRCDRRRIASRAVAEINAASPGPGSTKYGPALKLAGSLLAESLLPRKEVILVSDFQRGGWQPDDTLRLPGGTTITTALVEGAQGASLALTPVALLRSRETGQPERVTVTAGVLNRTATAGHRRADQPRDRRARRPGPADQRRGRARRRRFRSRR